MYLNKVVRLYVLINFSFSLVWAVCNETSNKTTNQTNEIEDNNCRNTSLEIAGIIIIVMIGIPLLIIMFLVLRYILKDCINGIAACLKDCINGIATCLKDCFGYFCGYFKNIRERRNENEKIKQKNREVNKILEKTFITTDYNKNDSCSICLDKLTSNVIKLKCNHIYHKGCIMPWLKESNSCPLCREEIILNLV